MNMMLRNRVLFIVLLVAPALLLAGIVGFTVYDLYEIRNIDPASVYKDLGAHLARKEPSSFPLPDEISERDPSKKTVFVFGESSIVISDGKTFPDYLGLNHDDLRVVNFGESGIDSFSIRQRVEEALSLARPDIIILYFGHNDFNNAYQGFIIPNYFQQFDCLLRLAYPFHDKNKPEGVLLSDEYYWFSRLNKPKLMNFFEVMGLIHIDQTAYEPMNQLIVDHFILNTEAMLDAASARHIPVVIITPVGNLRAEPYGSIDATTALYKKGSAATDYRHAIVDLKKARDTELLTYDLRAKSLLVRYIQGIDRPDVSVLDMEATLEDMQFGFGYEDFLDYFHFNDRSHRLLADLIYDFLKQRKLVRPVRGISK